MKTLQIVQSAYRCTIEEQDDPVIWIAHAMKSADADLDVLLRGNAVNYAVGNQDASGLAFGERSHAHPPQVDAELERFLRRNVAVYFVKEDADDRGISQADMIEGITAVSREDIPKIFAEYDQVWHW